MESEAQRFFAHPRYWLMFGLPWPTTDPNVNMAEAAYVLAPPTIPPKLRDGLSRDAADLLGFVDLYASEHPKQRVVWFSDVTRWLEWEKGRSWSTLGVDWESALGELLHLPFLGLYLTISGRAYHHLINTAKCFRVTYADGFSEVLTDQEREAVHEAFTRTLEVDWPECVAAVAARGQLSVS
ncbi:hypothetical protein [Micromonospora sp. WMMD712]|uniref:hypothetical protein n=1 Tax=Micromonospora sp. WMMD712 TaxID=3016096 RepID=UPI00249B7CEF|nr:hypothetical protein [Micromonospora sp. WMMD712]WFE60101.1 hypothetical protein O7633_26085 [Micromonospora sp. WMMD712]